MADPLSLLREYNINKKEIVERDDQIIFGEVSWPKNVKTNFATHRSRKKDFPAEYYTLECLLYILKNATLNHPDYCRQADADNTPAVRRPDRKSVLAYLNGETESCPSIDESVPLEIPTQVKRSAEDDEPENASKKPKSEEDTHVEKVEEQLAALPDTAKEVTLTVDKQELKPH